MIFQFGYISEVNQDKALYRVKLPELGDDGVVSPWMSGLYLDTKSTKDENYYEVNQHVVVLIKDNLSTGVILGAIYDNVDAPTIKDKNKRGTTFVDGSTEIFDKTTGEYHAHYTGNAKFESDDLAQVYGGTGVELNGNSNNGILKVVPTVGKLNIVENDLNNLKTLIAAWAPIPNDGGAALKAALTVWCATIITNTSTANLENPNVKH